MRAGLIASKGGAFQPFENMHARRKACARIRRSRVQAPGECAALEDSDSIMSAMSSIARKRSMCRRSW